VVVVFRDAEVVVVVVVDVVVVSEISTLIGIFEVISSFITKTYPVYF